MRLLAAVLSFSLLAHPAGSSSKLFASPFGRPNAIVSPDGHHALWGDLPQSQLWLEDRSTHTDKLVGRYTVQTISLVWSPDGRHFVVNDRETSTSSVAYLYDADALRRTNIEERLVSASPEVTRYLVSETPGPQHGMVSHGRAVMHSFVDVRRWIDDRHVEVQVHGNFAGSFRGGRPDGHLDPAGCFDLRYRMSLDGTVQKLSQRVTAAVADDPACGWGPAA